MEGLGFKKTPNFPGHPCAKTTTKQTPIWYKVTSIKKWRIKCEATDPHGEFSPTTSKGQFGLHGRCRMISYRMAFKYDTWQFGILPVFYVAPPQTKHQKPTFFSVSLPPTAWIFSFVAAVLFLPSPNGWGFVLLAQKKAESPIQNDSLGEALDRFFCISSWTVQWR